MWKDLENGNPDLAAFGRRRMGSGQVCYLATVKQDGAPRLHPVTPIIGEGRMFLFMEPTSPKGRDLERGSRFALHCSVSDNSGESGEFHVAGSARRLLDAESRAVAARVSSYPPRERYILFELDVDQAASNEYVGEETVRRRWARV